VIRNPFIGLRLAANGDAIIEFFGEDGQRAEVVFTNVEDLEKASAGFDYTAGLRRDFELYGYEETNRMHGLEEDPTNDYTVDDPDFLWHDDPDA
jgi:hypothetical protein